MGLRPVTMGLRPVTMKPGSGHNGVASGTHIHAYTHTHAYTYKNTQTSWVFYSVFFFVLFFLKCLYLYWILTRFSNLFRKQNQPKLSHTYKNTQTRRVFCSFFLFLFFLECLCLYWVLTPFSRLVRKKISGKTGSPEPPPGGPKNLYNILFFFSLCFAARCPRPTREFPICIGFLHNFPMYGNCGPGPPHRHPENWAQNGASRLAADVAFIWGIPGVLVKTRRS